MKRKSVRLIIYSAVNLVILAALIVFAHTTLSAGVTYCSVHRMLNIYCPGCGMTRSVWALFRLDILSVLRYNICLLPILFAIIYYDVRLLTAILKGDMGIFTRSSKVPLLIIPAFLVGNFALRNILLLGFGIDVVGDFIPRA